MTIPIWPTDLVPVVNNGFGYKRGSSIATIDGVSPYGLPAQFKRYHLESVSFSLNFNLERDKFYNGLMSFYDRAIDGGASRFMMPLDDGSGPKFYLAKIEAGSFDFSTTDNINFLVKFNVRIEHTYTQSNDSLVYETSYKNYHRQDSKIGFMYGLYVIRKSAFGQVRLIDSDLDMSLLFSGNKNINVTFNENPTFNITNAGNVFGFIGGVQFDIPASGTGWDVLNTNEDFAITGPVEIETV